jgi:hypothetical protein
MNVCEVVARTKARGSARIEVFAKTGGPSLDEDDFRGRGLADFKADRVRMTDQLATRRIVERTEGSLFLRILSAPAHVLGKRLIGDEALYVGGARWVRRGARWRGPKGRPSHQKNTWHPLFSLDILESAVRPLAGGRRVKWDDTEVTRYEFLPAREDAATDAWDSWLLSQSRRGVDNSRPRTVLWIDDDAKLRCVAYEAVLGATVESSLWSTTRLFDFEADTSELRNALDELEA